MLKAGVLGSAGGRRRRVSASGIAAEEDFSQKLGHNVQHMIALRHRLSGAETFNMLSDLTAALL
jgi:hypothetical protein